MTLADQLAPVLALAATKGVTDLVPGWLQPEAEPSGYWWDIRLYPKGNKRATHVPVHPDAATLIITGSLSAWLGVQGDTPALYRLWKKDERCEGTQELWVVDYGNGKDYPGETPLSALIAATMARLKEMPDKEQKNVADNR